MFVYTHRCITTTGAPAVIRPASREVEKPKRAPIPEEKQLFVRACMAWRPTRCVRCMVVRRSRGSGHTRARCMAHRGTHPPSPHHHHHTLSFSYTHTHTLLSLSLSPTKTNHDTHGQQQQAIQEKRAALSAEKKAIKADVQAKEASLRKTGAAEVRVRDGLRGWGSVQWVYVWGGREEGSGRDG